jgi:transcriptional regulator with XRE-family HTH domain
MRGMTTELTIGERVAWYRRRRGLSQEVLAGLVDRTADWLSRVENNRLDIDRLSVITALAHALDVSVGDLLAEPSLMEWTGDAHRPTVPALRAVLMDYRRLSPALAVSEPAERSLDDLDRWTSELWAAYQASRLALVTREVPRLLVEGHAATQTHEGVERDHAYALLALSYQLAATTLTKVGETDLSWIASDRGWAAAQQSGDPVIVGSLFRSVTHSLLSNSRYAEAVQLTRDAAEYLGGGLGGASRTYLSVYGSLFLAGAMAAARGEDRGTTVAFLREAEETARRLGRDDNLLWTAFGPTNVAIHQVSTAMELGDVQLAVDRGPRVDASSMPLERRVRHTLEVARAYNAWNRVDDALELLLDAERLAPEQIRYHFLSRQLVLSWIRRQRTKPSYRLSALARRLHVA